MPKKYDADPEYWNEFFSEDVREFCEKNGIRLNERQIGVLWVVCISDQPDHFSLLIKENRHFDFFSIYTRFPDDTIAVIAEMRRLHNKLSRAKRAVFSWGTKRSSDDEIAACAAEFWPTITSEEIAEARAWVSQRQNTRKKIKSPE